jgi:D-arabinose 1-dehydrogenase-like Zn-dependent alcohol dehydrogenase
MHAMVLNELRTPLTLNERDDPLPGPNEIRVKVGACGVCRTDLHVVDGDLRGGKLPIIPGHEIVGRVDALGARVRKLELGQRVGVPWLGHTDGTCNYCLTGRENLCDRPLFTGFRVHSRANSYRCQIRNREAVSSITLGIATIAAMATITDAARCALQKVSNRESEPKVMSAQKAMKTTRHIRFIAIIRASC